MITPDELNAMQARADAATPGEWEAYSASCCPDMGGVSTDKGYNVCQVQVGRVGHPMLIEDAEFCAHAREDVPRLVAEVRRLQAELADLCKLRPRDEYHEDDGNVLWWTVPINEPPYVGSTLDDAFPDYVTHWSLLPKVVEP